MPKSTPREDPRIYLAGRPGDAPLGRYLRFRSSKSGRKGYSIVRILTDSQMMRDALRYVAGRSALVGLPRTSKSDKFPRHLVAPGGLVPGVVAPSEKALMAAVRHSVKAHCLLIGEHWGRRSAEAVDACKAAIAAGGLRGGYAFKDDLRRALDEERVRMGYPEVIPADVLARLNRLTYQKNPVTNARASTEKALQKSILEAQARPLPRGRKRSR